MKRKLVTKIGMLKPGAIFWTDALDGGPFRLLRTDELVRRHPDQIGFVEGVSVAEAVRVSDGGLVSMDATHFGWVLAPKREAKP